MSKGDGERRVALLRCAKLEEARLLVEGVYEGRIGDRHGLHATSPRLRRLLPGDVELWIIGERGGNRSRAREHERVSARDRDDLRPQRGGTCHRDERNHLDIHVTGAVR